MSVAQAVSIHCSRRTRQCWDLNLYVIHIKIPLKRGPVPGLVGCEIISEAWISKRGPVSQQQELRHKEESEIENTLRSREENLSVQFGEPRAKLSDNTNVDQTTRVMSHKIINGEFIIAYGPKRRSFKGFPFRHSRNLNSGQHFRVFTDRQKFTVTVEWLGKERKSKVYLFMPSQAIHKTDGNTVLLPVSQRVRHEMNSTLKNFQSHLIHFVIESRECWLNFVFVNDATAQCSRI